MYCLHPISVRKWKEVTPFEKNGRIVKSERSNEYHFVPCGKCVACLARRRNEFTFRLNQEQHYSDYSFFLTLTYDQENVPIKIVENKPYFVFNKKHVQDYLKRIRYFLSELNKDVKCSYFLVSEYGKRTYRPHYHMLLFVKNDKFHSYKKTIETLLEKQWKFGFFVIKPTNEANIHYCTKYCIKNLEEMPSQCIEPVFVMASKRPYLGASAEGIIDRQFDNFEGTEYREPVVFNNGYKSAMPRIYRNKLGLAGLPSSLSSYDPRLTSEQYAEEFKRFRATRGDSADIADFAKYINQKFNIMERAAIKRQLSRSESF